MKISTLDEQIKKEIGVTQLSRERIEAYQLTKVRQTLELITARSNFYRAKLDDGKRHLDSLEEMNLLPFTTAEDLRQNQGQFLCCSQSEISRVVTLYSSGTTEKPKRLFFTPADLARTVQFFQAGMANLVSKQDRVLILLSGERTDSVGDLLRQALEKMGITAIPHGPVQDIEVTWRLIKKAAVTVVVGLPTAVLALARYSQGEILRLRSVLLSADTLSPVVRQEIERIWHCEVFDHYGMTEMGLGGGVECAAHTGFHLRENDLYVEIIHPDTREVLPEGEYGEVVFTTLQRKAMPLLRYRTGDISRIIPGQCSCGSVVKRLDAIRGRKENTVKLGGKNCCTLNLMDEALFSLENLVDFTVTVKQEGVRPQMQVVAFFRGQPGEGERQMVRERLETISSLQSAVATKEWHLLVEVKSLNKLSFNSKRTVKDLR